MRPGDMLAYPMRLAEWDKKSLLTSCNAYMSSSSKCLAMFKSRS